MQGSGAPGGGAQGGNPSLCPSIFTGTSTAHALLESQLSLPAFPASLRTGQVSPVAANTRALKWPSVTVGGAGCPHHQARVPPNPSLSLPVHPSPSPQPGPEGRQALGPPPTSVPQPALGWRGSVSLLPKLAGASQGRAGGRRWEPAVGRACPAQGVEGSSCRNGKNFQYFQPRQGAATAGAATAGVAIAGRWATAGRRPRNVAFIPKGSPLRSHSHATASPRTSPCRPPRPPYSSSGRPLRPTSTTHAGSRAAPGAPQEPSEWPLPSFARGVSPSSPGSVRSHLLVFLDFRAPVPGPAFPGPDQHQSPRCSMAPPRRRFPAAWLLSRPLREHSPRAPACPRGWGPWGHLGVL